MQQRLNFPLSNKQFKLIVTDYTKNWGGGKAGYVNKLTSEFGGFFFFFFLTGKGIPLHTPLLSPMKFRPNERYQTALKKSTV